MNVNPDWPRPGEVLQHFRQSKRLLELLPQMSAVITASEGPFYNLSHSDLQSMAIELIAELNQQCVLGLVASVEATFQVDLQSRRQLRKNDPVSRALRRLGKRMSSKAKRIKIEGILGVWKMEIRGLVKAIGELRQVIEYRHWLAHGRYWIQKSGLKSVDPLDVWERWEVVRAGLAAQTAFPLELG